MPINTAAVPGVMKIGGVFANLEELLSMLQNSGISYKNSYIHGCLKTDTVWSVLEMQLQANRLTDIAVAKIGTVAPHAWKQKNYPRRIY
ncbi:hypothetical protein TNCV_5081451 [Trichonephila clavipes]|nr:hypothetical protein TNCV_5081451 [Trichonephila clavipes]